MGTSTHSFVVFQEGSEEIGKNPDFRKYKGKLDFVFTSPPYFNREGYSDDPTQSLSKFPAYEQWRDGFLRPTLVTCVEYLRSNRYLAWNIADIKVGDLYYPLEQDSRKILEDLGMEFVGIEKMALMNMPGSNRIGADGKPTAKNFCKVDGKWRKYEPIFIFRKL
jgi:DNA modification methylase